jgi:methyl-accepting chemotaxis protein
MRIWIIVLAAFFAALVVVGAWIGIGLAAAPSSGLASPGLASFVPSRLPALVLAALTVYALVALLAVAGTIVIDTARARQRLARLAAPNRWDWMEVFAATGLSPLATRLLDLAPFDRERARARLVLQSRFDAVGARREIGHLYSGFLVQAQFITALALVLVFAAVGLIRDGAQFAAMPDSIPVVPALAVLGMLAALAVLGRIVVAAATEPLIEAIARLPIERLDLQLLHHLARLAEGGEAARAGAPGAALTAAIGKLLERLVHSLDESRNSLGEAIAELAAQATRLTAAMHAAAARAEDGRAQAADLAELRTTLTQLTTLMEGLAGTAPAGPAREASARAGEVSVIAPSRSDIGREVRDLLAGLE